MEIAVIAHDEMKNVMIRFLNKNKTVLLSDKVQLIATGTTGGRAEQEGFTVKKMLSAPKGAMPR